MIQNLNSNHKNMIVKFKAVLPFMPRDVWRCDPDPHNYEEGFYLMNLFYHTCGNNVYFFQI